MGAGMLGMANLCHGEVHDVLLGDGHSVTALVNHLITWAAEKVTEPMQQVGCAQRLASINAMQGSGYQVGWSAHANC